MTYRTIRLIQTWLRLFTGWAFLWVMIQAGEGYLCYSVEWNTVGFLPQEIESEAAAIYTTCLACVVMWVMRRQ